MGVALLVPNFMVSVMATRAVVLPFFRLFRRFSDKEEPAEVFLIGKVCRVVTREATHESGQAEVKRQGAPIKINVRTSRENEVMCKGEEAVIFLEDKGNNSYLIKKLEE